MIGDELNRKKKSRVEYRGYLRKLEKDITEFVNNCDESNVSFVSWLKALTDSFNVQLKNIEVMLKRN